MVSFVTDWFAEYREPGVQRRLLAEADLTLKKAFQLIQGMEAAAKNAEEMQRDKFYTAGSCSNQCGS